MENSNFSSKLAKIFVSNLRFTFITLILIVLLGVYALLNLVPTGFPQPRINLISITATYPGANTNVVLNNVTIPLESVVTKYYSDIDTYSSTINNGFTNIIVTPKFGVNVEELIAKIENDVEQLNLPDAVDVRVSKPEFPSVDFVIAIFSENREGLYIKYKEFLRQARSMPETDLVTPQVDLKQIVDIRLDESKLNQYRINANDIKQAISNYKFNIPIAQNVTIDNSQTSFILDSSDIENLDQLANVVIRTQNNQLVRLNEISDITYKYVFTNSEFASLAFDDNPTYFGFVQGGKNLTKESILLNYSAAEGNSIEDVQNKISNLLKDLGISKVDQNEDISNQKIYFEIPYSASTVSKKQIDEVVNGLLQGAILVFLVMFVFVSWRAAIIATFGIPISLIFALIYIFFTGDGLNTLVLFSLVLVVGLVVDPALVMLEVLQRKLDSGLSKLQVVIESIKEVGDGLLASTITNIIVFVPFAVVSGVLGQIFGYIPKTIIPAIVGSYVVSVVFLAIFGGMFLAKRRKKQNEQVEDEEYEAIWPISKKIEAINKFILNYHNKIKNKFLAGLIQITIVIASIIVPLAIVGYLFGTGQLRSTQFAQNKTGSTLNILLEKRSDISPAEINQFTKQTIEFIVSTGLFDNVTPFSTQMIASLKKDYQNTALEKAQDLRELLVNKFGDKYLDINVVVGGGANTTNSYQVNLAIRSDDNQKLIESSRIFAENIRKNLCQDNKSLYWDENCDEQNRVIEKVDNGIDGRLQNQIKITLDIQKILENNLSIPGTPVFSLVLSQLQSQFPKSRITSVSNLNNINETKVYTTINLDADVNLKTLDDVKNINIVSPQGAVLKLSDIANIELSQINQTITRFEGKTANRIKIRLKEEFRLDQAYASRVANFIFQTYAKDNYKLTKELGLANEAIYIDRSGASAEFVRGFTELLTAFALSIFLIYAVLVVLFKSFSMPVVVIFTIPLSFIGAFLGIKYFVGPEFGFLEIIGLIILVGIVVNVAIYMIDLANQKVKENGWDDKKAIIYASAVRFRPIFLTTFTSITSLIPLYINSDFYKSISAVIIGGLFTSTIISLFVVPVLYVLINKLRKKIHRIFHRFSLS